MAPAGLLFFLSNGPNQETTRKQIWVKVQWTRFLQLHYRKMVPSEALVLEYEFCNYFKLVFVLPAMTPHETLHCSHQTVVIIFQKKTDSRNQTSHVHWLLLWDSSNQPWQVCVCQQAGEARQPKWMWHISVSVPCSSSARLSVPVEVRHFSGGPLFTSSFISVRPNSTGAISSPTPAALSSVLTGLSPH